MGVIKVSEYIYMMIGRNISKRLNISMDIIFVRISRHLIKIYLQMVLANITIIWSFFKILHTVHYLNSKLPPSLYSWNIAECDVKTSTNQPKY